MSTTDEAPQGFHLKEFEDGFRDGYRGERRQTNRSGTYRSAYARGQEAERRSFPTPTTSERISA